MQDFAQGAPLCNFHRDEEVPSIFAHTCVNDIYNVFVLFFNQSPFTINSYLLRLPTILLGQCGVKYFQDCYPLSMLRVQNNSRFSMRYITC